MNRRAFIRTSLLAGAQALAGPMIGLERFRLLAEQVTGVSDRAVELVRGSTVIDMLSLLTLDWPRLYSWQRSPESFQAADLARLRACGIAVFHPAVDPSDSCPHEAALRWMAGWNRMIERHPTALLRIGEAADLKRVKGEGRVGLLLGFQNSNHFRGIEDVALFHGLGQRVSQLTYNERNLLGSGCQDPGGPGLTPYGAAVVTEMNRVGMAIDVSHCAERTSFDTLAASSRPVLVTHSNCRALVPHPRCKSDSFIRALAAQDGVIGITVLPMLVRQGRPAAIEDVLDHFDHVANLVGTRHLGLGSDTDVDGIDPRTHRVRSGYGVRGLRHAVRVFELTDGLLRRGYSSLEIQGILGGNFQRALGEIWSPSQPHTAPTGPLAPPDPPLLPNHPGHAGHPGHA